MRLSRQEMVEAAEDLRSIVEAGLLSVFVEERLRRLRDTPTWALPAPWQVQVEADYLAGIASKCLGGSPRQWKDAALAALGIRDREDVGIELLRELAERARDGQGEEEEEEERCEPADRRRREPPEHPSKRHCPIRSTIGSRKRGSR